MSSDLAGHQLGKDRPRLKTARWFVAASVIGLTVITAAVSLELLRKKGYLAVNQPAPLSPKTNTAAPAKSAATAVDPPTVPPSPTVPTAFGIYAVSGGKLHELDVLPGRAPDPRIAISSIITANSRTTLPDGHVAFVIYRRDSATNAADRAEVRVDCQDRAGSKLRQGWQAGCYCCR